MAKNQIITAIDIGTTKVATLIASLTPESEKISVIGVAVEPSKGLRKSQIVDIDETIESITQSVEAAERMAGYRFLRRWLLFPAPTLNQLIPKG